ncbi:MAG TPA: hypothetical protein VM694_22810, partial [Polyangium sp.]|nr:hypothetical protein [Polyangium sp.]
MTTARALVVASLFGLTACGSSYVVAISEDRCGPSPGPAKPLPSLGHDPKPFEIRHVPESHFGGPREGYLYRFEREDSGTTESLRAVHMIHGGRVLVVGDHGTALTRDVKAGWQKEDPGTTETLYALVAAPYYKDGTVITEELRKNKPYIAVGSKGAAVVRGLDGVWQAEQTGTSADLFALLHLGATTVAAGAGGTMLQCASRDGERVCIPRAPATEATLRVVAEAGHIMGDGIWLRYVMPSQTEPRPPPSYTPWPEGNAVLSGEEIRAAESNHWGGISEMLAVGRR